MSFYTCVPVYHTSWCITLTRVTDTLLYMFLAFPAAGMTAIPCACLGIFMGGLLVKKLNLSALGAIRMAMLVNLISTACYVSFLFLGCDTGPVAGVTVPYGNE